MTPTMDLTAHYREFFYFTKATTQELLEQAFKLRYEVYVKDCGYQFYNPYDAKKIEKDNYDECSDHCLLFHKPTNRPIGYVRLIPYKNNRAKGLPIENFGINFNENVIEQLRSNQVGEISRISIHHSFRRRLGDKIYKFENDTESEGNRFRINYLPICLVLACGALMTDNKLTYSVALMEHRLAMLIKRYGVLHTKIGNSIKLNGTRAPYMMDLKAFQDNLGHEFKALLEVIHHELIVSETSKNHA